MTKNVIVVSRVKYGNKIYSPGERLTVPLEEFQQNSKVFEAVDDHDQRLLQQEETKAKQANIGNERHEILKRNFQKAGEAAMEAMAIADVKRAEAAQTLAEKSKSKVRKVVAPAGG